MTKNRWEEYDSVVEWCAKRNIAGNTGDPLPNLLSAEVADEISENPEEFQERIRAFAYALSMSKREQDND